MDREAGYGLFFCTPDTSAAARHKIILYEHTLHMLLIYPHQCDHPLLAGWSGWEREELQEEGEKEEEAGFDRNGRLWRG